MDINQLPGSLASSGESTERALLREMASEEAIGRSRLPNYLQDAPYLGTHAQRRDYANVQRMTPGSFHEQMAESNGVGGGTIAPQAYSTTTQTASLYSRNCCN